MDSMNLYNSPDVVTRIKETAKLRNIAIKDLLSNVGLGVNALSHMNHGKSIAFDSLARIADYLDCSVDYLLGRDDAPSLSVKALSDESQEVSSENVFDLVKQKETAPTNTGRDGEHAIDVVDDELRDYLEELRSRPEKKLLFSVTKNATKEQIEAIVKMIDAMQGNDGT